MLKKSLVLGGSKFLGSHIVKRLAKIGFRVMALINSSDPIWRLTEIINCIELKRVNFSDNQALVRIIKTFAPDYIFFVSDYGEKVFQDNNELIYYLNLYLLKDLVEELIEEKFEAFIYIGSYLEHLVSTKNLYFNTYQKEHLDQYALVKYSASKYLANTAKEYNLPLYSVRPYFVYGSHFSEYFPFAQFLLNAALRKQLILDESFANKDFIHIKDFINFVLAVAISKPNKQILDCGSGNILELSTLLNIVKNFVPELERNYDNTPLTKKSYIPLIASNEDYKTSLSWAPSIRPEEGIKDLLIWISRNAAFYNSFFAEEIQRTKQRAQACTPHLL